MRLTLNYIIVFELKFLPVPILVIQTPLSTASPEHIITTENT